MLCAHYNNRDVSPFFFYFSILCRAAFNAAYSHTLEVRPESYSKKLGIGYDHNVKGMIQNYYDMT